MFPERSFMVCGEFLQVCHVKVALVVVLDCTTQRGLLFEGRG
jgi:hypothetical protein